MMNRLENALRNATCIRYPNSEAKRCNYGPVTSDQLHPECAANVVITLLEEEYTPSENVRFQGSWIRWLKEELIDEITT